MGPGPSVGDADDNPRRGSHYYSPGPKVAGLTLIVNEFLPYVLVEGCELCLVHSVDYCSGSKPLIGCSWQAALHSPR